MLTRGTRLVAVDGERKGDRGTYLETNGGTPPCRVQWEKFAASYWVYWRDVELEEGAEVAQVVLLLVRVLVGFSGFEVRLACHKVSYFFL